MPSRLTPLAFAASLVAAAFGSGTAVAHPHVWIEASSAVIFNDTGQVRAVKVIWRFDELYSAFAIQGADQDRNGETDQHELDRIAADNVKFLKEWDYFTNLKINGAKAELGEVTEFGNRNDDGVLEFSFTLPLAHPADPASHVVSYTSYDPSYYVAFELDSERPPRTAGPAPAACRVASYAADEKPKTVADSLVSSLTQDESWAEQYAPLVRVECEG